MTLTSISGALALTVACFAYEHAVHSLIDELDSSDWSVTSEAMRRLAAIGGEAVPSLIAECRGDSARRKERAIRCLAAIGPEARSAVPALVDALNDLRSYLDGPGRTVRRAAIEALVAVGHDALPSLTAALRDQRPLVRSGACLVIARIRPHSDDALERVAECLDDDDLDVRLDCVQSLRHFSDSGIPLILRAVHDSDAVVKSRAIWSLQNMGHAAEGAIPELLGILERDPVASVRRDACRAIAAIQSPGPELLASLARALKDDDADVRGHAALRIAEVGPHSASLASALAGLLDDTSEFYSMQPGVFRVCEAAALALESSGPDGRQALPAMRSAFRREERGDGVMRMHLAQAWAALGRDAAVAVPELLLAVRTESDPGLRVHLATAVLRIDAGQQDDALRVLTEAIGAEDSYNAWSAVAALGQFGAVQRNSAEAALNQAMRGHPDRRVRVAAAASLLELSTIDTAAETAFAALADPLSFSWGEDPGYEQAHWLHLCRTLQTVPSTRRFVLPSLIATLEKATPGTDDGAIEAALRGVAAIGPDARGAVPAMLGVWGPACDSEVRHTLHRIGQTGVPSLLVSLAEGRESRNRAIDALAELGPVSRPAVPHLIECAGDADFEVRERAIDALSRIAPGDEAVERVLTDSLADQRASIRVKAAWTLARTGMPRENVLAALKSAFNDEYAAVSHTARWAYETVEQRR